MINSNDQSLTSTIRTYLEGESVFQPPVIKVIGSIESVIERAASEGLTLQQYVIKNPEQAIREAELSLSEWLKIQSSAAIEGQIQTADGVFAINRNTTKLIEARVHTAQVQLDRVNEYAYTAYADGEKRKDHLIRTLYNRAIHKNDTKALVYLIDRVDGRPGESKVADLDYDNAYNVYQIIHSMFDKQLQVLNSGTGTRLICCSRQAGKSMLFAATALIEALRVPNTTVMYIGQTLQLTEGILDQSCNHYIDLLHLRDVKGKRLNWRKFDNGSQILVRGLSNTKDPDLIRGHRARVVIIDEFFHLKSELLEYMVREVLEPMQMSYGHDYIFLAGGTPPPIKGLYGEYAWQKWDVPHFTWTFRDNPLPVPAKEKEEAITQKLHEKGLDWTSTYARREYNGEFIYDDDLLLYPDFHTYNPREGIPQLHVDLVLFGIDYGVSDNDTLIGIAWDNEARRGYVFHEDKFNRLDVKDRTISQLQYLRGQVLVAWETALGFFPSFDEKDANKRILWDADDNAQHITDDLNMNCRLQNYPNLRLNIQNAHKTDKVMMFDKIRDLLRTAGLLLIEDGKTAKECTMTILKRGVNGQVFPEVDDSVFHPDLLPAMRYALWNVIGQESQRSM